MSQQGGEGARVEYNEYTNKAGNKSMSALRCQPIGRVDGGADLNGVGAFADAQIGPGASHVQGQDRLLPCAEDKYNDAAVSDPSPSYTSLDTSTAARTKSAKSG
jgi:hypothetical protein